METFKALSCTLEEFCSSCEEMEIDSLGHRNVLGALTEESVEKYLHRIPSADGKEEISFNCIELLQRWAVMPVPTQATFISCVREKLKRHRVKRIDISIQWPNGQEKRLEIQAREGNNGSLDFFLRDL